MTRIDKYNEYVDMCKNINQTPFPYEDNQWVIHKSQIVMNKLVKFSNNNYFDQSAADDYLDYLDSRY